MVMSGSLNPLSWLTGVSGESMSTSIANKAQNIPIIGKSVARAYTAGVNRWNQLTQFPSKTIIDNTAGAFNAGMRRDELCSLRPPSRRAQEL
jgi:hypothetical protein